MLTAEPIHPRLGPGVASVAVDISLAFTKFCTIITAILSSTRINTRLSGAKPHSQSSYPKPGSRSSQPRAGGGVSTPPQRQDHEGTVSRTVTLPSRPHPTPTPPPLPLAMRSWRSCHVFLRRPSCLPFVSALRRWAGRVRRGVSIGSGLGVREAAWSCAGATLLLLLMSRSFSHAVGG